MKIEQIDNPPFKNEAAFIDWLEKLNKEDLYLVHFVSNAIIEKYGGTASRIRPLEDVISNVSHSNKALFNLMMQLEAGRVAIVRII